MPKICTMYGVIFFLICLVVLSPPVGAMENETAHYIGSEACGACHPDQYDCFLLNSKKAKSYASVQKMAAKLTIAEIEACYSCHTTGYGHPGGFVSEGETPHLKNTGCEVCHGPGSLHVDSEDPADLIATMSIEECQTCHNSERVAAFNFKPLMYGGAH
jgi:hypothetical protein